MNIASPDLSTSRTRATGSAPEPPARPAAQSVEVTISDQGVDPGRPVAPAAIVDRAEAAPAPAPAPTPASTHQRDSGLYTGRGRTAAMPTEALQGQLLDVTG